MKFEKVKKFIASKKKLCEMSKYAEKITNLLIESILEVLAKYNEFLA